jgi:hypothetical protein
LLQLEKSRVENVYGVFVVVFVVAIIVGGWWLLRRALNADQEPTAGGSFGDLVLGDKNTRKKRRGRRVGRPE